MRALTRLWPAIKRQVPDARLLLVGWNARDALKAYIGEPDVVIEENVPDTQQYFEQTSVLLYAPDRCSGMKVKVLEAFAYGIPVVTTPDGVEGLPAIDGVHAGICDDDEGLVARTVNLLTNAVVRNRQRAAGRILLETHCGSSPTVDAIEFAYKRCGRG
jgi:glycosyltransferase involved in cell wall biosynthesis